LVVPKLLSLEVGRLHWLEHVLVLTHSEAKVLLLPIVEDSTSVMFSEVMCSIFWRNNLYIAVVRKKFHVRRAVKQDLSWDRWQRVRQVAKLFHPMCEAAILLKLTHTSLLVVAADLGFVI
jgi:hypothetical protein